MYEFLKKKKETQAERKRWRVKKKERKRKESYMTERNKYIKEAVSKVVQYSSILQKYYRVKIDGKKTFVYAKDSYVMYCSRKRQRVKRKKNRTEREDVSIQN